MKILTVCQYYHPEPFRIHEVCASLCARGHSVTVLTGLPNYPMGIIPDEYKGKQHRDEYIDGVHVIRVRERARTPGKMGLALNYVSFVWHAGLKALTMKKDFDVIFVYQLSPVLMAIPAYVAKWFSRTKHIAIYCLDLWPASLASLGIRSDSLFYRFMKTVSRRIYSGAYEIGYTSRMFETYFKNELALKNDRYSYIPQFADSLFSGVASSEKKKDTMDLVFAGNVGMMQKVDTIVKAAALTEDERIRWHIVGDGFALDGCRKLCESMKLESKVIFHGRLPVEEMPRIYSMADAMVVTLADDELISYTLPGKVQSYMAAGKPVLASARGETKRVIEESGCGLCVAAEDEKELAAAADRLAKEHSLSGMAEAARKYYDSHYTMEYHVKNIEKMLEDCADHGGKRKENG